MADREKVIVGLEFIKAMITFDPSTGEDIEPEYLNEADKTSYDSCVGAIALLKEQEPKEVKDKSKRIKFLDEYFEGECPSCRSFIDEHSNRNFCGYCGQAVKWD